MKDSSAVRDQMFSLIAEWEGGSLSQKAFCNMHQIPYHRFHYWYKRYRALHHPSSKADEKGFVRLAVEPDPVHTEVVMPAGIRIIFHQGVGVSFLQQLTR